MQIKFIRLNPRSHSAVRVAYEWHQSSILSGGLASALAPDVTCQGCGAKMELAQWPALCSLHWMQSLHGCVCCIVQGLLKGSSPLENAAKQVLAAVTRQFHFQGETKVLWPDVYEAMTS